MFLCCVTPTLRCDLWREIGANSLTTDFLFIFGAVHLRSSLGLCLDRIYTAGGRSTIVDLSPISPLSPFLQSLFISSNCDRSLAVFAEDCVLAAFKPGIGRQLSIYSPSFSSFFLTKKTQRTLINPAYLTWNHHHPRHLRFPLGWKIKQRVCSLAAFKRK